MKIVSTVYEQNESFYIGSFGYEDISRNAHWGRGRRDMYILHYVLEGEGFYNGHRVKCGNGFLIRPDEVHEYHSSVDNPWKYFWVTFGGNEFSGICKKYIKSDDNNLFAFDFKAKLLNLCDSIFSQEGALSEAKALSCFWALMSYHEKKISSGGHLYVEEAKRYMNIYFYRNISITEIADFIGINDRYLYNLFVKYENISPKKYLSNIRLNRAKSMLANTEFSISEIAVSTGFADVLAFSSFFSKNMKTSPTAYRKTAGQ